MLAARDFARRIAPALPPLGAGVLILLQELPRAAEAALIGAAFAASVLLAWRAEAALTRRLRTVASVLSAYREGDFSIRARDTSDPSPLRDLLSELNELGDALRRHRLGELEAWTLLRKVLAEIDVIVLAFSETGAVKLANDAAAKGLGRSPNALLGEQAAALGIGELLEGNVPRVVEDSRALGEGLWELRRGAFRLAGEPHSLVVLSDIGGALRHQEREAWKRLIRVMGHEINNSLAPIRSISENLQTTLGRSPRPEDWEEDLGTGLSIIARRAEGLGRFMTEYAKLARLPPPELEPVNVSTWVQRVASLERRVQIEILGGPDVSILGDTNQLDQMLINLVKNAADASLPENGGVRVRWATRAGTLELRIEDDGLGIADSKNLFVPFFTTKPGGSGIGLVLARQIAEAHGGEARLVNRLERPGAEALVSLPLQ